MDFETLYQIVNSVGCHMALSDFKALAKQVRNNRPVYHRNRMGEILSNAKTWFTKSALKNLLKN